LEEIAINKTGVTKVQAEFGEALLNIDLVKPGAVYDNQSSAERIGNKAFHGFSFPARTEKYDLGIEMIPADAVYASNASSSNKTGHFREIGHKTLETFDVREPLPNKFRVNPGLDKSEELARLDSRLMEQRSENVFFKYGPPKAISSVLHDQTKQFSFKPERSNYITTFSSMPNRNQGRFMEQNFNFKNKPTVAQSSRNEDAPWIRKEHVPWKRIDTIL
jgi:hypothetical protein